ncbi:Hypothetical_protein [Hexamita inflata]|uniref:Hypothetical_protein n=1 Tax=Hexamita inflata TaxID=28002 RepID=A0ABP1GWM1_9EUKA
MSNLSQVLYAYFRCKFPKPDSPADVYSYIYSIQVSTSSILNSGACDCTTVSSPLAGTQIVSAGCVWEKCLASNSYVCSGVKITCFSPALYLSITIYIYIYIQLRIYSYVQVVRII